MKTCTRFCGSGFRITQHSRRWASYDKSDLTKQALQEKVEAGLGTDADGKPLKIDSDGKTISTPVGDLPISPLMDPDWIQSRRRGKKPDPVRLSGRFRRKLGNNPYALALVTPLRSCSATEIRLPRYFFQDFELLKHPDPKQTEPWWAPGPLAFINTVPRHMYAAESMPTGRDLDHLDHQDGEEIRSGTAEEPQVEAEEELESQATERRPGRAPLTSYVVSHKPLLDAFASREGRRLLPKLLARRHGAAMTGVRPGLTVWRHDMGDVVLRLLRRAAVNGLATRANQSGDKFLCVCDSWEDAKKVHLRGCVLWIPKKAQLEGDSTYATVDVEGAKYGRKMAVHDLRSLLGEEELASLKEKSDIFRQGELFVLRQWRSGSMISLHQLLWRLQGYTAKEEASASHGMEENDQVEVD